MKNVLLLTAFLIIISGLSQAQNVAINATGNLPDASAMLDIDVAGKGLLIPRMTTAQRPASPVTSLVIYNTTLAWFEYWNGTAWVPFLSSSNGWSTSGNTIAGTEWIGTINNADWIIKTNNIERMRVLAGGTLRLTGAIASPGIWMDGTVTASGTGTTYGILSRGTLTAAAINDNFFAISTNQGIVNAGAFTGLTFYGAHIETASWTKSGGGTINNGYGLYVTAPTIAASNYAGVFTGGNVGIGIIAPTSPLHVVSAQPGGSFVTKIQNTTLDGELIQGINNLGNEAISWRTDGAGGFMAVCTAAGTRSTTIASSSSYFLGTLAIGTTSVSAGGAIIEVAGQVKITGGTPGLGKVLTSDATGLASWGNGPTSAGSGYMKLLYNDETDATGVNAQASVKTYAVPANSYSQVMVEAEVAYDVTSAAFGEFRFDLIYATVTKESLSLKQGGDVANTYKVAGVVKYSEAMPAGGTVQLDTVKIVTAANNWYVKSFRVYGIY